MPKSTSATKTLTLSEQEFKILRECVRLVSKHADLHEIFEDEDYDWEQQQETEDEDYLYENRPTSQLEAKLRVYDRD